MNQSLSPETGHETGPTQRRRELSRRLDDLRGFGILRGGADTTAIEGEEALVRLCLSLLDSLEATQRRVIETSIQILSLRELVALLLSLRTPEEVAETVTLYLQKAFDHERVLVGVYHRKSGVVDGWLAVRNGTTHCRSFHLAGDWSGTLHGILEANESVRASSMGAAPFLSGPDLPAELEPFREGELGPYVAYPLRGRSREESQVVGVLMVGRGAGSAGHDDMEDGILESVVEAVGTALDSVILEEDARREEAFRKDIMGSMASGLIAVDLEGRVLTMNAMTEKLTGFGLAELRGRSLKTMDPGLADLLEKTLGSRGTILQAERAVRRADGSAFPASCTTTLLRNPKKDVYGAVVTFNDLTEIKHMEERIRSLDRLAALGRFTAGIAHEIRNPLTGISTGVQYLERQLGETNPHDEHLEFIRREIARLDSIVEDLFRVTHPRPLQKTPEDPRRIVERAVQALGDLPRTADVKIGCHFIEDPPTVPVDPDQIQQVVLNLLKNAVEATPRGGQVDVHVYAGGEEERPHVVIQVMDSGPGIDPETLPQIFEPFFTKGKPTGTGLGLYVSHGIVERHGGDLHATNKNTGGGILTLMLPIDTYDTTEMLS